MNKKLRFFDIVLPYTALPQMHRHDFHEFFFNYEAGGEQLAGTRRWPMRAEGLYFFPAEQEHIGNGACHGGVVYVETDMFSTFEEGESEANAVLRWLLDRAAANHFLVPLSHAGRIQMRGVFADFLAEFRRGDHGMGLAFRILTQQMLLVILRDLSSEQLVDISLPRVSAEDRIHHVCVFLKENCSRAISVEMAAGVAGMSRSHFLAMFRRVAGCTLTEYINHRRCENATMLLKEGASTAMAAEASGFASVSNFYRAFRTITGRRPGDFRDDRSN